ncbi:DUF4169 family protein [Coralliovum pocilloporae]|uniref:DUF4169 family protein n=1 Tax=Coralliovum pocilloporae TaxID=3066369 RepID=UPI003307A80F
MTNVINLRSAKKKRERSGREKIAAANRVKFGRTKAQKELEKAEGRLKEKTLDSHQRENQSED